jgi:hypothetical protein
MNIHTVTVSFANAEDAAWFAKCAGISVKTQQRLDPCRAGILQDSLSKAYHVAQDIVSTEVFERPSRQPSNT